MELSAGKLWGLRRIADAAGRFKMTAVDQRPPIKNLVAERRGTPEAPYDDVANVKSLLVEELAATSSAMLLDPHYAYPRAIQYVRPSQGLILTLEDSVFEETPQGRRSAAIDHWSVEKIKRIGGDAVKVLAWYRPDADPSVCDNQKRFVASIGDACRRYDIPFVFELLLYPLPGDTRHTTDYVEQVGKRTEHVLESVVTFADEAYGVDIFKLESPIPATAVPDASGSDAAEAQAAFDELGRLAGRPWVMLSAGAGKADFRRILEYAYRAGASGYLAGRAIWWEAFQAFPDLDDMRRQLRSEGVGYMEEINRLTDEAAVPWHTHPRYGEGPALDGDGAEFRATYAGFSDGGER
ncbi:MAG TPA: tagatose 1,6-diphosphate aldolase [Acidimicrobiia bacterium]|jgi:tagatose 1,6-diphosphate aldolase|nr:tagatose 1,6-diphosphate aldolase [Acidimicrobiia bacterium]